LTGLTVIISFADGMEKHPLENYLPLLMKQLFLVSKYVEPSFQESTNKKSQKPPTPSKNSKNGIFPNSGPTNGSQ
jgi:hypothetical protein